MSQIRSKHQLVVQHVIMSHRGKSSIIQDKRWQYDELIPETLEILGNTDCAMVLIEKIKGNMPRYVRVQCHMLKRIAKNYDATTIVNSIKKSIQQNIYDATHVLAILVESEGIEKAKTNNVLPVRTVEHYKRKAKELSRYDALMRKDDKIWR